MGMTGLYMIVTATELDSLFSDPNSFSDFFYGDNEDAVEQNERIIDVDKAWHAIHFTLNGTEWEGMAPLFDVVLGGEPIGDDNSGYGPPRGLKPSEVRDVAISLSLISESVFRTRVDLKALMEHDIYPSIWNDTEDIDYVVSYYVDVRNAFLNAAESGDGMVLYIS